VTKKGIWGTGLLALAALATMCTWQHRPEQVTNTAATVVAPQVVLAPKVSPAAMPPVVTGPSKAMTPATTAAAPEAIAPAAPQPAVPQAAVPAVVAPAVEVKPEVKPEVKLEVKPEPKAVPQVVDVKPDIKLAAPTIKRNAIAKSAKPFVAKAKTVKVTKAKKRVKLLKTAKASGCEFRRDQNVVKSICFNFNSDRLSARSKSKLDALVPSLKSGDKRYELNGFADSVGTKTYNSELSERRNQSVLKYLQSKGVDASKLSAKGNGSDEASKLGTGKNQRERRVDVRVL
jgi:outer membrane protein OmpA-like peptidoglycan-associated protein